MQVGNNSSPSRLAHDRHLDIRIVTTIYISKQVHSFVRLVVSISHLSIEIVKEIYDIRT